MDETLGLMVLGTAVLFMFDSCSLWSWVHLEKFPVLKFSKGYSFPTSSNFNKTFFMESMVIRGGGIQAIILFGDLSNNKLRQLTAL